MTQRKRYLTLDCTLKLKRQRRVEVFLININMPTEGRAYLDCKNNLFYASKVLWLVQPKNYRAVKRNDRGIHASAISPPQGLYYYSLFVAYFETPSVSQIYVGS